MVWGGLKRAESGDSAKDLPHVARQRRGSVEVSLVWAGMGGRLRSRRLGVDGRGVGKGLNHGGCLGRGGHERRREGNGEIERQREREKGVEGSWVGSRNAD